MPDISQTRPRPAPFSLLLAIACPLALLTAASGAGCGGGGGGGAGGTGGGGGGATGGSGALYRPCAAATEVGEFSLRLLADTSTSVFAGGVRNGVLPEKTKQEGATEGGCRLIVPGAPTCSPACPNPQICGGPNQCIDEPRFRGVGDVTLSGVGSAPIVAMPNEVIWTYDVRIPSPYPPATPGANLTIVAAGGELPGFTLSGRGVPPLETGTGPFRVMGGQAFSFTWTPHTGGTQILASLDVAHHGGVSALIECDFADDGSGEMPAGLIDQLLERGVAGFPELTLVRRTVDSTTTTAGCVEFHVASEASVFPEVCRTAGNCVISCSDDSECPDGQICRPAGVPGGLSCGTS